MKVFVFVLFFGLIASSSAGFAAIKALGAEKTRTVLPPRVYLIPQNVYLPLIMPDTPALPYISPPSYGPPQPYAAPSPPPQPYGPPQMPPPSYPSAPSYPSPPSYSPPMSSYDQSQY